MEQRTETPDGYERVREFVESPAAAARRLTAEWMAGRLAVPVVECAAYLDHLASRGLLRRRRDAEGAPWFEVAPPPRWVGLRRALLGTLVLCASIGAVVAGAALQHVFYFAMGLALGLMIAFAWLDWEMRSRL